MHIFFSMDSLKLMLCVVIFSTHLVISKIVVEARDESLLSNRSIATTQSVTATTNTGSLDYAECQVDQYECEPGHCISMDSYCDGLEDCSDGSDEIDCSDDYDCSDFSCGDGQCIELSAKCNGIEDCSDGSDEISCSNVTCSADQFTCGGDNKCVDKSKTCDGFKDCTDGSDETDCLEVTKMPDYGTDYPDYEDCPEEKFKCDNGGFCLEPIDRCNGIKDCFDETDEENCPSETSSAITTRSSFSSTVGGSITASPNQHTTKPSGICGANSFECDNGDCISDANVCNGQNDCDDGSDEATCPTGGSSAIMSAITSAVTTSQSDNQCEYNGSTYAPEETIEGDICGGLLCNSSGQIVVWTNTTCSASSAKVNSLMLGLLTAYGTLYAWR